MIICRNLNEEDAIDSVCAWFDKCPPEKGKEHWVDGRSAKELAKYWCSNVPNIPLEFGALLKKSKEFPDSKILKGSPEYRKKYDQFSNGGKHDLLLICEQNGKKSVVAIEAKVDEKFGSKICDYYRRASCNTKMRIKQLLSALFGTVAMDPLEFGVMYQLIHATAGLLAEAKRQNAKKALFIANTFVTKHMDRKKYRRNLTDLNLFVKNISGGTYCEVGNGNIIGPIKVPGNDHIPSDVSLYIGELDICLS